MLNKLSVIASGVSLVVLTMSWYYGVPILPWVSVFWCFATFMHDLKKVNE